MKPGCITVLTISLCCILIADQSRSYGQPGFSTTVGVGLSTALQSPTTKIPPAMAMRQVKQEFDLVRLFDSVSCNLDEKLMDEAMANSLEIVLTVPNNCLGQLDADAAMYVTKSVVPWKDNIKAIIAGREIFEMNGQGEPSMIVTRMNDLVTALAAAGLNIPVTTNISHSSGSDLGLSHSSGSDLGNPLKRQRFFLIGGSLARLDALFQGQNHACKDFVRVVVTKR